MTDALRIDDAELAHYHSGTGLADRAHALILQQRSTWDLARQGYASLDSIEVRTCEFDGYVVKVQFNPGRLTSSSVKVDDESIRSRR